jgi:hypothetical protein
MAMMSGFGFDGTELDDVREDEDNTYDPDNPHGEDRHGFGDTWDDELAPCGCYADDPGCPHRPSTGLTVDVKWSKL